MRLEAAEQVQGIVSAALELVQVQAQKQKQMAAVLLMAAW